MEALISELNMPTEPPPCTVAKGIVPRIHGPSDPMQAVKVTAKKNDKSQPFYVKLRAEVTQDLLRRGRGNSTSVFSSFTGYSIQ